jgi:hypothetical protein
VTTAATIVTAFVVLIVCATIWHFVAKNAAKDDAAREAALRVETEKEVQRQRAAYDAPGVTEAAAQDVPKRKRRTKA